MQNGYLLNLGLTPYEEAWLLQNKLVALKKEKDIPEFLILLEHLPILTLGRRGKESNLRVSRDYLEQEGIPLVRCERGGDITYHGPGQLVAYPILSLNKLHIGVKDYVNRLEEVIIRSLGDFDIPAGRHKGFPGVWVEGLKIASIGICVKGGVAFHGLALNCAPNPAHLDLIIPCGMQGVGLTSLEAIKGCPINEESLRESVLLHFEEIFEIRLEPMAMTEVKTLLESVRISNDEFRLTYSFGSDSAIRNRQSEFKQLDTRRSLLVPRKPSWLKKRIPLGLNPAKVKDLLFEGPLHTVCQEARCPNQGECFGRGSATFLLMGDRCTRNCSFCAVTSGLPDPLNEEEPMRIAQAVEALGLSFAVLTSVTRDDLPDGGAGHFNKVIEALRSRCPDTKIECLIPDFQGFERAWKSLAGAAPQVINHNIETISRLYPSVRPGAEYQRSLALLNYFKQNYPTILTKSGFMIGLGETPTEIRSLLQDLLEVGCRMVTIGQYLQPSPAHRPVSRYATPEEFKQWEEEALQIGFSAVASGPFVRSSYKAVELFEKALSPKIGQGPVFLHRTHPGCPVRA